MRKIIFAILVIFMACNGVVAQSLGKMTLGCKRADIPLSLPRGFNICKTNTNNQLIYTTSKGDEHISFYLENNIVYKIVMHKFVDDTSNTNKLNSKLEELLMNLYGAWGEPSYVGENVYWNFPSSKCTFSYVVSTQTLELDPLRFSGTSGLTTFYKCYADIKLEKIKNLFE